MSVRPLSGRVLSVLLVVVCTAGGLWAFRGPLLRGLGAFLIREDALRHADALYVLGGASLDRGHEAARVMQAGWCDHAWFTGSNIPTSLESVGIRMPEADVSLLAARRAGLPVGRGSALHYGTSTAEEADAILVHAHRAGHDTIMVLSSKFHLRRIHRVFARHPQARGITVLLHGAPAVLFREEEWWRYEDGLVMLANEYLKLVYYAWRY